MLSSINAGPQRNALAGKAIASLTIFVAPTCCHERSMVLMRSGNRMSVGVMGTDARLWTTAAQHELASLQQLLEQRQEFSDTRFVIQETEVAEGDTVFVPKGAQLTSATYGLQGRRKYIMNVIDKIAPGE